MLQKRIESVETYQKSIESAAARSAARAQAEEALAASPIPAATTKDGGSPVLSDAAPGQHSYPTEAPTGAKHTVKGVLHGVKCSYPTVLTLSVEGAPKAVSLYTNDFYKVTFMVLNDDNPGADLNPCKDIDGKQATVHYAEVSDKSIDGQILGIELSK